MQFQGRVGRRSGGGYEAWFPPLPGCEVVGRTRREAMQRLSQAVEGYIEHIESILPRELARRACRADSAGRSRRQVVA